MNAWPVEDLCERDVATVIIDTDIEEVNKFLVCSTYWDGRIENVPKSAIGAMKLAREKDYTLVWGGDMNARNTLYGSNTTETRGK